MNHIRCNWHMSKPCWWKYYRLIIWLTCFLFLNLNKTCNYLLVEDLIDCIRLYFIITETIHNVFMIELPEGNNWIRLSLGQSKRAIVWELRIFQSRICCPEEVKYWHRRDRHRGERLCRFETPLLTPCSGSRRWSRTVWTF